MSESDLVRDVVAYITMTGGVPTRVNSGFRVLEDAQGKQRVFRGAEKGTSDIIACIGGRYVAIECKIEPNKPTQAQLDFLERVRSSGGVGIVAYSLDDVMCLCTQIEHDVSMKVSPL